jgi:hypothetical protein
VLPQQGPYGDRCSISKANGRSIHLYLSQSPVKELSHEIGGKHTVTVHEAPGARNDYIQWGVGWFPKWIVNDTANTTPVPCSHQHNIFHLGSGRPEDCQPQCFVVTLYRMSPAQVRTRVWVYGMHCCAQVFNLPHLFHLFTLSFMFYLTCIPFVIYYTNTLISLDLA